MKKKKKQNLDNKCNQFDNSLHKNILKEFFRAKSPYVILSNKTFYEIKLNIIMLTKPQIEVIPRNRKLYYDIKYVGSNVNLSRKGKYYNLNPSTTKKNIIFVLISIHEMIDMDNLGFSWRRV